MFYKKKRNNYFTRATIASVISFGRRVWRMTQTRNDRQKHKSSGPKKTKKMHLKKMSSFQITTENLESNEFISIDKSDNYAN